MADNGQKGPGGSGDKKPPKANDKKEVKILMLHGRSNLILSMKFSDN